MEQEPQPSTTVTATHNNPSWWFLEKKVIEQFKSAYIVNKDQQVHDCYMSPQQPTKKHGKKNKNQLQPVSATLNKAPKASVDDLDQTIPLI